MSCSGYEKDQAHYVKILAEFADLIKFQGITQTMEDFQLYQPDAYAWLRGYVLDN